MLISITSKLFDLAGSVLLNVPDPDYGQTRRRATRVATLDGGAVVNDGGYSESDRQIQLRWRVSSSEDETLRRIVRLHSRIVASTPVGVLESIIEEYSVRDGQASLTILPVARLDEA